MEKLSLSMDWLSADFYTALLAIIVINVVLSGDNAIVIALAARKLPKRLRSRAIIGGTLGAILLRVVATLAVVWLLKVPGLQLLGGIMLVWIAYQLVASGDGGAASESSQSATAGIWAAVRTIMVADAVMSLDNMLGVAGAAQGSLLLVVLGLLISIPIMVFGSTIILRLVDRFPIIVYIGAAVLAWTAANMLIEEPWLEDVMNAHNWVPWAVQGLILGGVLLAGFWRNRFHAEQQEQPSER
jgi:YjbE family integral membrane protein